jgi:hypothetical protein
MPLPALLMPDAHPIVRLLLLPIICSTDLFLALFLALSIPYQWAFSLFAFIYSGSETTFQGFVSVHSDLRTGQNLE